MNSSMNIKGFQTSQLSWPDSPGLVRTRDTNVIMLRLLFQADHGA